MAEPLLSAPPTKADPVPTRRWSWRVAVLVAGDAVSFLVFASAGRTSHSEALALGEVVGTALPFALGWFVVSPFFGAFRRAKTDTIGRMLARTELAWLCAWPVALLARLALGPDHQLPMPFPVIVLVFNALFLGVWRGVFAVVERFRG